MKNESQEKNRYLEYFEKFFKNNKSKIADYLENKEKAEELIENASRKAERKKVNGGPLNDIIDSVKLLFALANDYVQRKYKNISYATILLVVGGIFYFVLPFDLIFDGVPVVGWLDDATVLAFIIKQINAELQEYKKWKAEQNKDMKNDIGDDPEFK
jgi:uncharacterized membrane protein YkvA (DUF1232 family)